MFVDTKVVKEIEGESAYDKFALASTLLDVSFKGASCSIIESRILNNCSSCNLRPLCEKIDGVLMDYVEKTTVITKSFNFGSGGRA